MSQEHHVPPQPRLDYEPRAGRAPVAVPVLLCLTLIICGSALVLGTSFAVLWTRGSMFLDRLIFLPVTWLPIVVGLAMIVLGYWHARH